MVYDHNPCGEGAYSNYVRRNQAGACEIRIRVKVFAEDNAEEAAGYGADQGYVPHLLNGEMNQHGEPKRECRLNRVLEKNCNEDVSPEFELLCGDHQTGQHQSGTVCS